MCECSGRANSRGYSRPEHFARHGPVHRSDGQPPEDQRERIVEPYDGLGARPYDIADVMVVARDHPRGGARASSARARKYRRVGVSLIPRAHRAPRRPRRASGPADGRTWTRPSRCSVAAIRRCRHVAGWIIASVDRSIALWQDRRELESRDTWRSHGAPRGRSALQVWNFVWLLVIAACVALWPLPRHGGCCCRSRSASSALSWVCGSRTALAFELFTVNVGNALSHSVVDHRIGPVVLISLISRSRR
jgi:hypothetical protein